MSHLNLKALDMVVAFMYRLGVAGWGIRWRGMGTLFLSEGWIVWRWVMQLRYLLWMWLVGCIARHSVRCPFGTLHKVIWRFWLTANMFCILCVGISEENNRDQSS